MKKFSKILVLLLTFSLLLGALAVFASADVSETDVAKIGDTGYATFELAFAAAMEAEEPVTITLLGNTTKTSGLTVSKSVTIDLNWYTLDASTCAALNFNVSEDASLTIKNGMVLYADSNFVKLGANNATFNGLNLTVLSKATSGNKYAFELSGTGTVNVNLDNSVISYASDITVNTRIFNVAAKTINMEVKNSVLRSRGSNVFRVYNSFIGGELNFTNSHMSTDTQGNARLFEAGSRLADLSTLESVGGTHGFTGSAENLNVEYDLIGDGKYKVTATNLGVWNFYNCSFHNSSGDCTIGPIAAEMHLYGGYYYASVSERLLWNVNNANYQYTGKVYLHTYTDENGVVHYPAFNNDISVNDRFKPSDFYDYDLTFTFDGESTYGAFTIENAVKKTGGAAMVANANAASMYSYLFVPNPSGLTESVPVVEGAADNFTDIGSLSGVAAHACPFPWVNINPWFAGKTLTKIGIPVKSVAALDENQTFTLQIFDYTTKVTREAVTVTLPLDQLGDSTTVNKWVYVDLTPYNITLGATESVAFGKTGDTVTWGYGSANTNTFDFANVHTDLTTGNYNTAEFTPTEGSTRAIIFDIYYAKPVAPADAKLSLVDPTALPNAVAMLNGKLYSDFGLAAAAAGEGDIITLLANVSGGTEVIAPVTVNTNGFEFAPNFDTAAFIIETVQGNLAAIAEVSAEADFIDHYYWKDAESCAAANDEENGFDWDSFDWEAGVAPEGLLAYKALPVGSTADVTSVAFAGVDLSYVDEENNYFSHTGWKVLGGSEEEFFFDYTPETESVGKATFLIINDETGAIIGSGYTDGDGLDEETGDTTNYSTAFTNALMNASANTTIKLVADIEIFSDNNTVSGSPFTLDLNGHVAYISDQNCVGKTIAPSSSDTGGHKVGTNALFRTTNASLKMTIKSSLPGGMILNVAYGGNQLFWIRTATTNGYINIEGENLTVYSNTLFAANANGAKTAPFQINIDGGEYYTTTTAASQGVFQLDNCQSIEVNVKNAFFDTQGHYFFSFGQTAANVANGHFVTANFEDTVIMMGNYKFMKVYKSNTSGYDLSATTVNFKNVAVLGGEVNLISCKATADETADETFIEMNIYEGCFFSHEPKAAYNAVGCSLKPLSGGYKVTLKSSFGYAKMNETKYDPTKEVVVNDYEFELAYGTTYATVDLAFGGETVTQYVYVPEGGTTVTLTESATENYIKSTYTATVAVAEAGKTYTGTFELTAKEVSVSGVKYNLTLASEIAINVAVPADVLNYLSVVVDGKTFTKENATLITIGEEEYYVITYAGITATDTVGTVEFAIVGGEGVTPANVVTSVAAYANKLMTKGANDVEKELGRALLVYTLEAYKALDAENTAAIEALTAYAAAVPEDESFMAEDTAALAAYFEGAFLRLESTPGIVFVAKEAAIGKTFTFTYVDENLELVSEEVTFTAEKLEYELEMKVYNLDQNITFTVDGSDTALSYNLDTYLASLAETNNAFAQAIYRYVNAAKAYVTAE